MILDMVIGALSEPEARRLQVSYMNHAQLLQDPYANVYSSYGRSNPYDNERSSQGYGSSSLDCGHYSHDSGRSYQDYRNPYGYTGPGYGYGFDYGASSEPSYLARRSTEEDRQSTKQVASDDDESKVNFAYSELRREKRKKKKEKQTGSGNLTRS